LYIAGRSVAAKSARACDAGVHIVSGTPGKIWNMIRWLWQQETNKPGVTEND